MKESNKSGRRILDGFLPQLGSRSFSYGRSPLPGSRGIIFLALGALTLALGISDISHSPSFSHLSSRCHGSATSSAHGAKELAEAVR
jgi:hypothetical protein